MMASSTVRPPRLAGAPEWVFRWRGSKQPLFPRIFALALVGGAFTFLVGTVRVTVDAPGKSIPRKASVIYLDDDAQGRALTLRAQQGGPFPSRFTLSQWQGLAGLEATAMDAAQFQPPPYAPVLQDLPPENLVQPVLLAAKGESFFPDHDSVDSTPPEPAETKLAPKLYALAGLTRDSLPETLPDFQNWPADATPALPSPFPSWRFLVRLDADGNVAESVSLEKGNDTKANDLEAWLRRLQFKPEPGKPVRWIALGIGFTNQPADADHAR